MKTLGQFLSDLNGNFCEVSGSANAKNQCVDLANAYLRDVCNHPIIQWTNACDFPSKIKDMEWIPNDEETDLPQEGDIIIWNSNVGGGAGHIAIFLEGTTSKFNSFDQNWPLYSPCHVQSHTYSNVSGWLRPNGIIQEDMTTDEKRALELLESYKIANKHGNLEGAINALVGASNDLQNKTKEIETLTNSIKTLEAQLEAVNAKVAELEAKFVTNQKELKTCQTACQTANEKISELNETISNITEEKNTWQTRYNNKNTEFNDLKTKYDELEAKYNSIDVSGYKPKFNLLDFIKSLFKK